MKRKRKNEPRYKPKTFKLMKKRTLLLLAASMFVAGNSFAQIGTDVDDGVYVDLLPEGVTVNVKYEKKQDKEKNKDKST